MADSRPVNLKVTAILYALLVLIVIIIGGFIVFVLNLSYYLAFLSVANGKTFTELLFNSAVIVSTFLITIAPVTFSTFFEKENKTNKDNLRKYLKVYMIASIVVLLAAVVLCSMWISETRYSASTEASLLLLFIVTTGYFFLCFPVRQK